MCALFEPPRDAHIVFLGDSTIRYLYIALAFAWRHGHELQQIDYIEEPGGSIGALSMITRVRCLRTGATVIALTVAKLTIQ